MKVGYARVSTDGRDLDIQRQALAAAGCTTVYEEKITAILDRPETLHETLGHCRKGDVLVVWKLDRLGRSLLDLVSLIEALNERGIGLRVLTGPGTEIDTTTAQGQRIFQILASLAEIERELIRERTRAGMDAARKRGIHVGRPKKLSEDDLKKARLMINGGISKSETASTLGVTTITLRRALHEAEKPAPETRQRSSHQS